VRIKLGKGVFLMRCSTDKLISYIDNTLSEEKAREVEEHLKKCVVCREAYNSFKIIEAFEEEHEVMAVDITSKVMSAIDKDKYSNKKYRYFNKFMTNRLSIYRGVAVAGFVLIFTGCVWVAKEMDLFNGIRSTAELQQTNDKSILDKNSENKEKSITLTVNKDMIKNSEIKLTLYNENFKETNTFNPKEINSKLDKIPLSSTKITLEPIKETMNLGNPVFKVSIKYEKINYEYYGFNTPAHLNTKAIVLQQSNDYVEKNNKYLMLYEDLDLLKNFMEGLMEKENVKNSELPEKYTSDMAMTEQGTELFLAWVKGK